MGNFLSPLRVERLDGCNKWRVLESFSYRVGSETSNVVIYVRAGFITDFASIPRGLWNLFPPVGGKYDKASVLHDALYQYPWVMNGANGGVTYYTSIDRAFADSTFKEAMKVLKVGSFSRWMIYSAVRVGGGGIWTRYRTQPRI